MENDPVSVTPVDDAELIEYAKVESRFSIHDGLIVATHRSQGMDATITIDDVIPDADCHAMWK